MCEWIIDMGGDTTYTLTEEQYTALQQAILRDAKIVMFKKFGINTSYIRHMYEVEKPELLLEEPKPKVIVPYVEELTEEEKRVREEKAQGARERVRQFMIKKFGLPHR